MRSISVFNVISGCHQKVALGGAAEVQHRGRVRPEAARLGHHIGRACLTTGLLKQDIPMDVLKGWGISADSRVGGVRLGSFSLRRFKL